MHISLSFLIILLFFSFSNGEKKTYILVHGGWHGAWCWSKLTPLLEKQGHRVVALDLPGHGNDKSMLAADVTFSDYVDKVVAVSKTQVGKVILVGHSMSGIIIAQAAESLGKEKVSALVFLDAFMPRDGDSVMSLAEIAGKTSAANNSMAIGPSVMESIVMSADHKTSTIKPESIRQLFYHDCSDEDVSYATEHVSPQPMICLATPARLTQTNYGSIRKYYILCTDAHDLNKSSLTGRVKCEKVFKLKSSHSPFFSMPEQLANILIEI
ncbi:MAG: alpha/beta fold hydrolase [Chryseolinea sp.]